MTDPAGRGAWKLCSFRCQMPGGGLFTRISIQDRNRQNSQQIPLLAVLLLRMAGEGCF